MPPLPPSANPLPRLITYYQTHHDASTGNPISVLPLITQDGISLTHLILAAIHINDRPDQLTLNEHPPSHPRFQTLWAELRVLQASGVKVLAMLGGAARGSYQRLDGDDARFERFYAPLRDLVRERALDGLDLDVEEDTSLGGIVRLIDRLRRDFGPRFTITLAPVAAALLDPTKNLSGFDYEALEVLRGRDVAWYNAQFYYGWGDMRSPLMYDLMVQKGWPPHKLVVGLVTSPANGPGFVEFEDLAAVLRALKGRHPQFGGVMGWEFFNGMPGASERPWEWARLMTRMLRGDAPAPEARLPAQAAVTAEKEADPDRPGGKDLEVPRQFEYFSDELEDD